MCVAALLAAGRPSVGRRTKGRHRWRHVGWYRRLVFVVLDFVALRHFVRLDARRDMWCVRGCRQCRGGRGRGAGL